MLDNELMNKMIKEYYSESLTVDEITKRYGIGRSTFYKKKAVYDAINKKDTGFKKVKIVDNNKTKCINPQLVVDINGASVIVDDRTNLTLLKKIIEGLK